MALALVTPPAPETLGPKVPTHGDLASTSRRPSHRQIGEHLYLAEKTIKNYVSNLLMKLGMHRRTEAAVYAARIAAKRDRNP
jgi:hypothetical protein